MDCRAAAVTVRVVEPEMAPSVALMFVRPTASAVAFPAAAMVAMEVAEEFQVTVVVRSFLL